MSIPLHIWIHFLYFNAPQAILDMRTEDRADGHLLVMLKKEDSAACF